MCVQQRRLLKKHRGRKCNIPTNSCKFPTEEIMDAPNFNFARKWGIFNPRILYLWKKNSDKLKFRG